MSGGHPLGAEVSAVGLSYLMLDSFPDSKGVTVFRISWWDSTSRQYVPMKTTYSGFEIASFVSLISIEAISPYLFGVLGLGEAPTAIPSSIH